MSKSIFKTIGAAAAAAALAFGLSTAAQAANFGKPGEPIKLTVGYQPYYTQSWSGVVIRGKELWKKYLPKGSTVDFQIGLQGAIIVGQLMAEKQQIGYMGDMPALVSTTKPNLVDVRLIAVLGTSRQQCNIVMVRNDAPKFKSGEEAIKWMEGKRTSSPHGSCTDRFARYSFEQLKVKPAQYLNQNIEVITTGFKAGKLDAAVIWEPTASKIELEGIARRAASGHSVKGDEGGDAGFLGMAYELIKQRPDVLRGWLEAELDAQLFMIDPKNANEVVEMAAKQTEGMSKKVLWYALYGDKTNAGGGNITNRQDYIFTDQAKTLANAAIAFLHKYKKVPDPKLRDGAIMDQVGREILKARGLKAPLGEIKGQPLSAFKG
ncbi:MAG: nitrate ABC transporter substrate-binding protein [Rhodospirillales bacterium RIFCSPLOWO2_01_FULL_65_14]|nr:MAG: nitrate ABC transporter substrate-binding protein [Rhodospirillales bacterium RIFCSPLOWO2_01_FULL_65_14]